MPTGPVVLAALVSVGLFLLLRLYPIWRVRSRGCDAYNILLCAEHIRRERRLPPRIPGLFLLEGAEQWYPPVFLVLAALFPERWLQQRFWLLNQLVDVVSALVLFSFVVWTSGPLVGLAAVLAYATMAGLVQEFAALNTRPLGLLVLNLLLLTSFLASQDTRWLPAALVCGVILIFAHKLSAQQLWFSAPVLAALTADWRWLALVPAIYLAAWLAWPGGFREVIAGHVNIVRFWHRNWPFLGAHAIRQSPIYGDGDTRQDYYAAWGRAGDPLRFGKEVLHHNYFVVPALLGLVLGPVADPFAKFLLGWILSAYLAAAAVHFTPQLRGIGLGQQYIKFALLPSLIATAISLQNVSSNLLLAATVLAVALELRQYWLVAKSLRTDTNAIGQRTGDLDRLLTELADDRAARILVLPVQLCDLVAYATRRPVYWGTHAQVFDQRLEAFFPVLRRRLSDYVEDGKLTRLLLDTRYAEPEELGIRQDDILRRSGDYALIALDARGGAAPSPAETLTP